AGGTSDSTPASRTWRVLDTTAPDTRISDGPSATSTDQSATFSFSSTEDGSTFQCSLDGDRKSTRLNSSHSQISYAVICLKKKNPRCWPCRRPSRGSGYRTSCPNRSPRRSHPSPARRSSAPLNRLHPPRHRAWAGWLRDRRGVQASHRHPLQTSVTSSRPPGFFFFCSGNHRNLHSFPTRRSSD